MAGKLSKEVQKLLMTAARREAGCAYAPYSRVRVGAAVLSANDRVFVGCNVENASYGLTVCAERVAMQNAVAAGEREIVAVAVFSPDVKGVTPCGACRQVMMEFAPEPPGKLLVLTEARGGPHIVPLNMLLPAEFRGSRRVKS